MKIRLHIRLMAYGSLAILLSNLVAQDQSVQSIVVTDEDSRPVACYVNGIPPDGKSLSLGRTDPSGKFKFSGNCVEGYGLQFIPEYGSIYFQKVVFCKEALAEGVKLKRIPMPETAALNAAIVKEVESDPGSAAFVSNLLATKVSSKAEALSYKITTLVQWGKFLNVEKPMIYNGEDWFMASEELVKATKTFQKGKGLIVTGAIDSKTLESAADVTKLGEILKKQ